MCIQIPRRNIICRSFAISMDKKNYGSSFAIPINGTAYLITAAHIVKPMKHGVESELYIFKNNEWKPILVIPYYMNSDTKNEHYLDIVLIQTSIELQETEDDIELSSNGLVLGQDIYFLGFPFLGIINYTPSDINDNFPLPLIKKATLSGCEHEKFFLDGHNNVGFSGGPAIFWNYDTKKHQVFAVISSYINYNGQVKSTEQQTNLFYQENSGIALAYRIEYVNKFLKDNGLQ